MPFRLISGAWRTQAPEQFPQGGLARRAKARGELLGVARSRARTSPSSAAGCGPIDPLPPPVTPGRCPQAARGRRRSPGLPARQPRAAGLAQSEPAPGGQIAAASALGAFHDIARPDSGRRPSRKKVRAPLRASPQRGEGHECLLRDTQVISTCATQYLRSTTALRHRSRWRIPRVSGT